MYTSAVTRLACFNNFLKKIVQDEQYFLVLKMKGFILNYFTFPIKYNCPNYNNTHDSAATLGKYFVGSSGIFVT